MPQTDPYVPVDFVQYIHYWYESLPIYRWQEDILQEAGSADAVAICSVDVINAFAHEGILASDRVRNMLPHLRRLFLNAHEWGVTKFLLLVDSHSDEAAEFRYFPAHAAMGTSEARIVPEIENLPMRDRFTVFVKNSFHPANGTSLDPWLMDNPEITHFVVSGCGTDMGVYLLATYLHTYLLAHHVPGRVIVPANCTDTYDISIELARDLHTLPHPAEIFYHSALYHLAIHGVTVVKDIR